jgi:hypothetical protein
MAFSVVRYTGNYSQTTFNIPFEYMVTGHLKVTVNGVSQSEGPDYTVLGGMLTFNTAPALGHTIIISRNSSQNQLMTDYQDGITLTKGALDVDSTQAFYMAQEALDGFGSGESMGLSTVGSFWDAQGRQIKNVGAPTDPNDAATKAYVDAATSAAISGSGYVQKIGDTMTGLLTLSGDPTLPREAATKQYVDAAKTAANAYTDSKTTPVAPCLIIPNSLNAGLYSQSASNKFELSTDMTANSSTAWTGTPSTNAVFVPRAFAKAFTQSRIGIRTVTSSSLITSVSMRIVVYSDNNGQPGTILLDSGGFTPPSATTGTDVTTKYYWYSAAYSYLAQTQYWFGFWFTGIETSWAPQAMASSSPAIIARSQSAFGVLTTTDLPYYSLSGTAAYGSSISSISNNPATQLLTSNAATSANTPIFYFQSA